MIALIIAVLQFLVVGVVAARRLDPTMPRLQLLGAGFLLGGGICAFVLFALAIVGIPWSPLSFTIAYCAVTIALYVGRASARLSRGGRAEARPTLFDLATLVFIAAHAAYAWTAREWDFWAIWGLKARVFFEHRGIDWAYLENPGHAFMHPDYPPLAPFNFAQLALLNGGWLESEMGLLSTLYAVALILIVRDFFAEELEGAWAAGAATLAVAPGAFTLAGTGDAPMIAYAGAALLMIRRESYALGAIFLGFAACTKNEGMALIAAAAIALLLTPRRKAILRLWPAVALAAPWLILKATHTLPSDLAQGSLAERAMKALTRVPELARAMADRPPYIPFYWLGIAIALVVCARRLDRERFLLAAVFIQLSFYLLTYLMTPYDLWRHFVGSWPRILPHMAVPLAYAAVKLVMDERPASTSP